MLKSLEDISSTKKRLRVEIPPETVEERIGEGLRALGKRTRIPGYRQGKAPVSLIEKRYGKEVETDVLQKIIPEFCMNAVKEAELKPVTDPAFEENIDFKRNSPIKLTFTVEVIPKIENLNYKGIKVTDIPFEIKDSEIDDTLKRLRKDKASYEPTGGPLAEGDLSVIDLLNKETGSKQSDQVFTLGSDFLPREFTDALTGKKKGDEFDVKVTYPGVSDQDPDAGKVFNFHINVKEAKKATLPDMDDEFAKDLDFDSLEALKDHVRAELTRAKETTVGNAQKGEALSKILEANKVDVPETLLERELTSLLAEATRKGGAPGERGGAPAEGGAPGVKGGAPGERGGAPADIDGGDGDDIEKLRPELSKKAEKNIQASILIDIIGKEEGITVSEGEFREKIDELSAKLSLSTENVVKYYMARDGSIDGLMQGIFEDKVLSFILENAERVKGKK